MYLYVRSMSEAQSEVYRTVANAGPQIIEHLIKLIVFRGSEYINHWKQEIYSFLYRVPKLKNGNKWPKKSLILKALTIYNDTLDTEFKIAVQDEPYLITEDIDLKSMQDAIEEYQNWLSDKLSCNGFVSREEVYNKLDGLINRRD